LNALVVFESMFGNTGLIAEAVADGLARRFDVERCEVGKAPEIISDQVDLVVVGGPTHAFSMSRPGTRSKAADETDAPLVSPGIGLREWLAKVSRPSGQVGSAAFDTRVDKPRVPGSAAVVAAKRLRRLGFRQVVEPESFFVVGMSGPLLSGEYERAHRWGETLAAKLTGTRALSR
jgi:hypothetical protein